NRHNREAPRHRRRPDVLPASPDADHRRVRQSRRRGGRQAGGFSFLVATPYVSPGGLLHRPPDTRQSTASSFFGSSGSGQKSRKNKMMRDGPRRPEVLNPAMNRSR